MRSGRRIALYLLVGGAALAGWRTWDLRPILAQEAGGTAPVGSAVALVELFTSEGCSSCPPADRLLAEIDAEARQRGRPVLCLSFHVDYWDHLGWKDPFSSARWTDRQKRWAKLLRQDGLYTPEMVVNGAEGFVGSRRDAARQALEKALAAPPPVGVRAAVTRASKGLRVSFELAPAPSEACRVVAALVEDGLVSHPDRGENGGRELPHARVVRALSEVDLAPGTARGELTVELPQAVDPARAELIVWVERPRATGLLGATRVAVPAR